ncbi:DUF488 family protein [Crocinitomicaceae bacterium CZZ-1]|uniref:DUF488 family protein n=1 Tax=Taishania pollutisoli TaxID=2766479 RepID=A0A8J6PK43_9FLAO|nr:DUF488 family protein [Taishania pollutisoli]MBC9812974.1 DUF488 family protein [Taishania pollutisoli]
MSRIIHIKRVYEQPEESDGYRILVDRLWPRGIKKEQAHVSEWNKEVAPSTELRTWFDHRPERFEQFSREYRNELLQKREELIRIQRLADKQPVTLIYAAKDPEMNHVVILCDVLSTIKG